MDSVLNYPLYDAIVQGFSIPGPKNLSGLATVMGQIQNNFKVFSLFSLRFPWLTHPDRTLLFSETSWKTMTFPDGIVYP